MTVQIFADNVELPNRFIKFSDGGSNIKIDIPDGFICPKSYVSISVDPITPVDNVLWELFLASSALVAMFEDHEEFNCPLSVHLPYLPHARADRAFEKGNAKPLFSFLRVLAQTMPNIQISLTDPHSDFYKKIANLNFVVTHQHECFINTVRGIKSGDVLVSPDEGAKDKIKRLQLALDYRTIATHVVEATKKRNIADGKILETHLPPITDLVDKVVYIVDDIADGGGTFIPLAEKLKQAGAKEVHLYVTHGIFAKGLNIFKGKIDKLHVYQTVSNYVTQEDIRNFNAGKEVQ